MIGGSMKATIARLAPGYWMFLVGTFAAWAPWTRLWNRNAFIILAGPLEGLLISNAARGAFSGAGVLLALAGAREALMAAGAPRP